MDTTGFCVTETGGVLTMDGKLSHRWMAFTGLACAMMVLGCARGPLRQTVNRIRGKSTQQARQDGNHDTRAIAALASVKVQTPRQCLPATPNSSMALSPNRVTHVESTAFWDMSLDEAIRLGLANSDVLRDLGGQVVGDPDIVPDRYQVAMTSNDPRFGVQAALSAFDAQLHSRMFAQNNDRVFNNTISGLGANEFRQDLFGFETGITKRTATGAQFSLLHRTDYDANSSPTNLFPSAWNTNFDATVRVPLLRGGGVEFHRIAGPDAQPGFFLAQGVLLARVNEDISLADFEQGVVRYVNEIETSYWALYFAYRNLEAIDVARESTQRIVSETSESVAAGVGTPGFKQLAGEIQLHSLDDQYQNALAGAPGDASPGVYRSERDLRWLIGLPATDNQLIRPSDHPSRAGIDFDWPAASAEALARRVELRRQQWNIKRKRLEVKAAKNFLLPQLDAYSTLRIRGFGDDLTGGGSRFSSAWRTLGTFDYQEMEGGLEFSMPAGFRQGWAAVRHANLSLARAQAQLKSQNDRVLSELSQAIGELDRAAQSIEINRRRLATALAYQESLELAWQEDNRNASIEARLDAISQVSLAQTQFHRAIVDHVLAIKDVHVSKGSLLKTSGVLLSETQWPSAAFCSDRSVARQWASGSHGESKTCPPAFSAGDVDQMAEYQSESTPAHVTDDSLLIESN